MGCDFYVSAGGNGDGSTPGTPMSIEAALERMYGPGDRMLLNRGDVFYGPVMPKVEASPDKPFTLGAYGQGERPRISLIKIISQSWTDDGDGFYHYNLTDKTGFDGWKTDSDNVGFIEDSYGVKWGKRMENAAACKENFDFYCAGGYIRLRTDKEPFEQLGSLILAINGQSIKLASNMDVEHIHVKYSGGHGIVLQKPGVSHCRVRNCVIEDIGGARLGTNGWTKYGNGIEYYGGAAHMLVENNIIRNTFDVGFTLQGGSICKWNDIIVRGNVFAYNTQALEIWTAGTESDQGIDGLTFEENICICQGDGWGTPARPDKRGGEGQIKMTDILVYAYKAPVLRVTIQNNIFYNPNPDNLVFSVSTKGSAFWERVISAGNVIYAADFAAICYGTDDTVNDTYGNLYLTLAQWQENTRQDKDTVLIPVYPGRYRYWQVEETARLSCQLKDIFFSCQQVGISFQKK